MTNEATRRRARPAAIATSIAAALLLVLATASPAGAAVTVSDLAPAADSSVNVSGSVPAEHPTATHVAVSQCNISELSDPGDPDLWGTRCNADDAVGFTPVAAWETNGVSLTVRAAFDDFDFVDQVDPETSTECDEHGTAECGVVVSYYFAPNFPAGPFFHLGAEHELITVT